MNTIGSMLSSCGAVLLRQRKHFVWRLPNGQKYVTACTPSDRRAEANQISELRHRLGAVDYAPKTEPGERREKRHKPGRDETLNITAGPDRTGVTLREQLSATGIVEQALRVTVEKQRIHIQNQRAEIRALREFRAHCWGCRLRTLMARLLTKLKAAKEATR
jgi:hypothetical protein